MTAVGRSAGPVRTPLIVIWTIREMQIYSRPLIAGRS